VKASVPVPGFRLADGDRLDVTVAVETFGNPTAPRTVLVCHALTGNAHALSDPGEAPGWWEILRGEDRFLDPERDFVIVQNVLGGCDGTTGPRSPAPDRRPFGPRFPRVSVRDMVRLQHTVLQKMGIDHVDAVIGGSLGGMQALEWAFTYPEAVGTAIAIGATLRADAMVIAWNAAQRAAIALDPVGGLEVARMIGMITYRSRREFDQRFGRKGNPPEYLVGQYLHHHGRRLAARFDPWSYVRLTEAMDGHDVFAGRALPTTRPPIALVGIENDLLFPAESIARDAELLASLDWPSAFALLPSDVGHDAFLIDGRGLSKAIAEALAEAGADAEARGSRPRAVSASLGERP
jgi:homoserine O-acetyltransferase